MLRITKRGLEKHLGKKVLVVNIGHNMDWIQGILSKRKNGFEVLKKPGEMSEDGGRLSRYSLKPGDVINVYRMQPVSGGRKVRQLLPYRYFA